MDEHQEYSPISEPHEHEQEKNKLQRDFEDLTLAELVQEFFYAPIDTLQALITVAAPARRVVALPPVPERRVIEPRPVAEGQAHPSQAAGLSASILLEPDASGVQRGVIVMQLGLYALAFGIGLWGGIVLAGSNDAMPGVIYLGIAFMLALGGQMLGTFSEPRESFAAKLPVITPDVRIHGVHVPLLVAGLFFAVSSYFNNAVSINLSTTTVIDVRFTFLGVLSWILSVILIAAAFYRPPPADPDDFENFYPPDRLTQYGRIVRAVTGGLRSELGSLREFYRSEKLVFWMVVAITVFGAFFRLQHLDTMLPEMTSDHVEKLLDAQRVFEGDYQIFFANNQGREPFQMYALALMGNFTGINFMSLKLLAAIEAILTLPVMFWLGREIIGERDKRFGILFGLSLMLLLSVSYWHFVVARVALRIILTPLVVALFLIYLMRGMRRNSRADFIKVGLVLGFGLYTYQAVRMLPAVLIVAAVLALLFHIRSRRAFLGYAFNFVVAVVVAFVIFIPMFRYSVEYPDEFWRRTTGRLFGDALVEVRDDNGNITLRQPTLEERAQAFNANLPILGQNMVNALMMFHLKGDVAWLHGYPNHETMDVLSATFLIVGLGGWFGWSLRRQDAVYWLIPLAGLVMLLPSALSIALPIENPSHTRTSGAMPEVYAFAGFGLAMLLALVMRLLPRRAGVMVMMVTFSLLASVIYATNYDVVFNPAHGYRQNYLQSGLPHSEAGRELRNFAQSAGGGFGNGFIVSSPYWWDHRAVGIEALLPPGTWENTIPEEGGQPKFSNLARLLREAVQRDRYTLDPNKDLLFFYSMADEPAAELLPEWFPNGYTTFVDSYMPGRDFYMFRVPALGVEGLRQVLEAHGETF